MRLNDTLTLTDRERMLGGRLEQLWLEGASRRHVRRRMRDFTYGRQWDDAVRLPGGELTSEGELMQAQGRAPVTNNLIRQLVKNVMGRWLRSREEPAGQADLRTLEEFLISGMAVQRVGLPGEPWQGRSVYVSPDRMVMETFGEPDASDCHTVAMLHDLGEAEYFLLLGENRLTVDYWRNGERRMVGSGALQMEYARPAMGETVRVVELWQHRYCRGKERWVQIWMRPDGRIFLRRERQPGERPPFAIRFYPMIDSEVHSLVEDVVSQQKVVNRMVSLLDEVLAHTAKGVLIYPVDQLPPGMTWEDVSRIWSTPGGVIPFRRTSSAVMPREVTGAGNVAGASELLRVQIEMFADVAGVATGPSAEGDVRRSAEALRAEDERASTGLAAMLAAFDAFIAGRDELARAVGPSDGA